MSPAGDTTLSRRAVVAAAWLSVLSLAGCGPGVGGSGTGRDDGSGGAASPPPGGPPAPAPQTWVDSGDGSRVQARIDGTRLRIAAPCLGIAFDGERSASSAAGEVYDGLLGADATRPARAETLAVGTELLLTLRDGAGGVLLGPLALVRNDTPPPLSPCG